MKSFYNNQIVNESSISLLLTNRSFLYGDGLFETIISANLEIKYLSDHVERLHKGMSVLRLKIPPTLQFEFLKENIKNLLLENNLTASARIKIIVWRKTGGYFISDSNEAEFVILANEFIRQYYKPRKVKLCETVTLRKSLFSAFKRCSSLEYVLAGLELKEKGMDDLIILDTEGNISECIYSNIFWIKDYCFFTPNLETGCIDGIRRKNVIKSLVNKGIEVSQVRVPLEYLLSADYVFSCNVAGIYPIQFIEDKEFSIYSDPLKLIA